MILESPRVEDEEFKDSPANLIQKHTFKQINQLNTKNFSI